MKSWKTNYKPIEGQMTFWEWLESLRQNEQILLKKMIKQRGKKCKQII